MVKIIKFYLYNYGYILFITRFSEGMAGVLLCGFVCLLETLLHTSKKASWYNGIWEAPFCMNDNHWSQCVQNVVFVTITYQQILTYWLKNEDQN